jgi:predicted dehydrogenase
MSYEKVSGPIKFGIIGCGLLGKIHAERLTALPDVHVVAVYDPDEEAMQRVADVVPPEARGGRADVRICSDFMDVISDPDVNAININSPNHWHVRQLLASLERGHHVLCEKPLSLVPEEVSAVVEATERSNRLVCIAYQRRYHRNTRVLRSAIHSGRWGKVTGINAYACEDWVNPNRGTWRHDPERCPGGYFVDASGHQIDIICWMTGLEAAWVRATAENRGTPVPIVTWGEARMVPQCPTPGTLAVDPGAGAPMVFNFYGAARKWREELVVHTEGADFLLRNFQLLWSEGEESHQMFTGSQFTGVLTPFPESLVDPDVLSAPDLPDPAFISALREGPDIVSPPETVRPVLRFTLAALKSARSGNERVSTT